MAKSCIINPVSGVCAFHKIYETDETKWNAIFYKTLIINWLKFRVKQNETTYKSVNLAVNPI